jgi:DNA-binding response OmpR family regulator
MTESRHSKILVVDDERDVCEILIRWLRAEGYECSMAFTGEEALRALRANKFELVLSDIIMPGMSGIDLLQIMRPLFPDVAVLMVTAVDDATTGVLAVELGAYGYLIKPFNRNEILISVAGALERRRERLNDQRHPSDLDGSPRKEIRKRHPITVSAVQAADCIRSGMDDASLMEKFNLSGQGLHSLLEKLVAAGKLTRSEVDDRTSLSPGSVVVDIGQEKFLEHGTKKVLVKAFEAANLIRSGIDDLTLMRRYSLSRKGLQSLFRKLVAAGIMDQSQLESRTSLSPNSVILDE